MLTTEDMKKYHTTAERILNALDNSSVPISWHDMDRCALQKIPKHGYICPWCENLMRRSMRNIPKKRKERK